VLLPVVGCFDGDGDNDDSGTPPPPAPGYVAGQEVTLRQGTATLPPTVFGNNIATFSVKTTGTLKATITWSGPPNDLDSYLRHNATATFESTFDEPSPIVLTISVTRDLVDAGEEWLFNIRNDTGPEVEVLYIVTFTAG